MTTTITLHNGKVALIDDDVANKITPHKWSAHLAGKTWYARREVKIGSKRYRIYMHREVIDAPPNTLIDHKNGNSLDNRKENLRYCTRGQNRQNENPGSRGGTSNYKGVHWDKSKKKWAARIGKNGEHFFLGRFDNEISAATAYNNAAKELFGEFARLNVIQDH